MSVGHDKSARQVVSLKAVALETGCRKTNPLRVEPKTGAKSKTRLPSYSSYSKWIFLNITSCYINRRQRDNMSSRFLVVDGPRLWYSHFDLCDSWSSSPKDRSARWRWVWVCQCQPVNDLPKGMATTLFSWCGVILNVQTYPMQH
ncbi:hypothetical protein AVEN_58394-1 [Araneus ventricosus]|uniref:Uncharacterized protein n=1 Tax=Araneus ventricosus TaxID=182803 RepID=A0A4Y2IAH8_ARAVE|nr:hypothetical protein AVEN_58394-1 [Araneus ventricosus]